MEIDRRAFFASMGGAAAVGAMSHEAKADALEHYMLMQLNAANTKNFPKAADVEAEIETRPYRRGAGNCSINVRLLIGARLSLLKRRRLHAQTDAA